MSSFAAAVVSRLTSLSPIHHDMANPETLISSQDALPSSSKSFDDARSCHSHSATSASTHSSSQDHHHGLRRNEHLAVLLPKSLWKPDSQAARCDIFLCGRRFSIFERRHHCRKCGGVFCSDCSTRETTLLDTSNLEFLNPPRGVPVSQYDSPTSQVVMSRVCDDCWDQIHGTKVSRSLQFQRKFEAAEQTAAWESDSSPTSSASASPRSPYTPLDSCSISNMPLTRQPLRRAHTSPRVQTYTSNSGYSTPSRSSSFTHTPAALDASLATLADSTTSSELDAYPLRHASAICKANGGGRWEPKPIVQWAGHRVPGTKAAYEIELEKEAEEVRLRKLNPVYSDGIFQLRAPKEFEPRSLAGPITLSTF